MNQENINKYLINQGDAHEIFTNDKIDWYIKCLHHISLLIEHNNHKLKTMLLKFVYHLHSNFYEWKTDP